MLFRISIYFHHLYRLNRFVTMRNYSWHRLPTALILRIDPEFVSDVSWQKIKSQEFRVNAVVLRDWFAVFLKTSSLVDDTANFFFPLRKFLSLFSISWYHAILTHFKIPDLESLCKMQPTKLFFQWSLCEEPTSIHYYKMLAVILHTTNISSSKLLGKTHLTPVVLLLGPLQKLGAKACHSTNV